MLQGRVQLSVVHELADVTIDMILDRAYRHVSENKYILVVVVEILVYVKVTL
jgi:hypothetical protein